MNDYTVRRRRGKNIFAALFAFIMLGASIYCLFVPLFKEIEEKITYFVYTAGIIGVVYFGYLTIIKIILSISPESAITFSEEGMYDFTLPGGGAGFISWDNIKGTKIYGNRKSQYLGIEIEKPRRVFRHIKKKTHREIIENLSSGMPALVIDCRGLEASPQMLAEEIDLRRKEYNKLFRHIASKNIEQNDIYVRRQGSATLSEEDGTKSLEFQIVKEDTEITKDEIEEKVVESLEPEPQEDADREIDDILRSLNLMKEKEDSKEDSPDKKPLKGEEGEAITKEQPSIEYRDYGLLFPDEDEGQ